MRIFKLFLLCFFAIVLLFGCQKELTTSEYFDWILNSKNGFYKKEVTDKITVEALNKPIPYIIANEFRNEELSSSAFNTRKKELKGMQYFDLKVSASNGESLTTFLASNEEEQQSNLYYLSYDFQKDIKLLDGKDTLACRLYHYERYYQLGRKSTITLGFPLGNNTNNSDKTLIVHPRIWADTPIKINFSNKDLQNIPALKIEQ